MNKKGLGFEKKTIFVSLKNLEKSRNMFYLLTGRKDGELSLSGKAQLCIHPLFNGILLLFICLINSIFAGIPEHSLCGRHKELKPITV